MYGVFDRLASNTMCHCELALHLLRQLELCFLYNLYYPVGYVRSLH